MLHNSENITTELKRDKGQCSLRATIGPDQRHIDSHASNAYPEVHI